MGLIQWLQSFSTPVLALLLVGGTTVIAVAALLLVRHKVPAEKLERNNELAGIFFSMVGVMYAIILAFMVFAVWDAFQGANRTAQDEATTLDSMYRDADLFPGPTGQALKQDIRAYSEVIVEKEWPAMAHRGESPEVDDALNKVWDSFEALDPQTEQQKAFYAEMTHNLNEIHTLRHDRLLASRNGLPSLLWIVVFAGGLTTLSYVIYFGQANFRTQLLMTITLAVSVSFVVLVVLVLDNPFAGELSVHPAALQQVLLEMSRAG